MRFASSDRLAKLQSLEPTQSENPRPTGRRSRRETSKWLSFLNENVYACLHKARDRAQRKEKRRKNRFDFQYCKRKLWNFVYICNIYECVCVWVCSKYKTMFTSLTKYERCVPFCLFIFGKYKLCTSNLLPIISFTNTSRLSLRYRMAKRKASADFSLSLSSAFAWWNSSLKSLSLSRFNFAGRDMRVCLNGVFDFIAKTPLLLAFILKFSSVTIFLRATAYTSIHSTITTTTKRRVVAKKIQCE